MRRTRLWWGLLALCVVALAGWSRAGEAAEKPAEEGGEEGPGEDVEPIPPPDDEGDPNEVMATVDNVSITRGKVNQARRLMAATRRGQLPNNEQILEQLINRVLWERHFDKGKLRPPGAQVQDHIRQFAAQLSNRGLSYQRWLVARGLSGDEHADMLSYEYAMRNLIQSIRDDIKEEQIKAEYDAHPEYYDGSRVRISQIVVDTSNLGNDPEALAKAKKKAEDIHKELLAGKDFDQLARDKSDGPARGRGGDRGWFRRKGPEVDEALLETAWKLNVNEFAKPVQGVRGWHILKVTDREPARLTYFGSKDGIVQELIRRKLETILDDLKGTAKIERKI